MLKEKEKVINNLLALFDVFLGWIAFCVVLFWVYGEISFLHGLVGINILILVSAIWYVLSKMLGLSELYRSRLYSIVLFNCLGFSILGTIFLGVLIRVFYSNDLGISILFLFGAINFILVFFSHIFIYSLLKSIRKRGFNYRSIVIIGDKSSISIINQIIEMKEWGYRIEAIISEILVPNDINNQWPVLSPKNANVDKYIAEKMIDELFYCKEKPDMKEVESLIYSCNEVGVVFRMYSPFFNMLTHKMHLQYFSTTPLLTFSNTHQDYWSLKLKQLFDFLISLLIIVAFSSVYILIAILIKSTSKGPIFFKQKRVGLRGREFWVYKFRTMVVNAEELKADLNDHNEMDGPAFKISNDPRITGVGKLLRKTSLDELPQFFNVFMGNMSIVGPRPPIPEEVKLYERWQRRRLSMKPGITCIWQVSPSRNDILFDEWMRMDLDYIDNWSPKLDFVIVLKTIRAIFRADGK